MPRAFAPSSARVRGSAQIDLSNSNSVTARLSPSVTSGI
jgi:hypothetical protein